MSPYRRIRELAEGGASYKEIEDRMAEEADRRYDEARDRELEEQTENHS